MLGGRVGGVCPPYTCTSMQVQVSRPPVSCRFYLQRVVSIRASLVRLYSTTVNLKLFIHELIPNAIDGQNILWLAGFVFDLAADIFDLRVNCAFVGVKALAMDRAHYLCTCEHAAGVGRQCSQQLEL